MLEPCPPLTVAHRRRRLVRPRLPRRRPRADRATTGPVGRDGRVRVLVAAAGRRRAGARPRCRPPRCTSGTSPIRRRCDRLFDGAAGASVVHAAGVIHPARVADFDRVNADGTRARRRGRRRAGVRRLVHVSSNSPFGVNAGPDDTFRADEPYRPYLGYGTSKMARRARGPGGARRAVGSRRWSCGRRGSTGPGSRSGRRASSPWWRPAGSRCSGTARQRRSMAYVDNLVQGVALAERHPDAPGARSGSRTSAPTRWARSSRRYAGCSREEGYVTAARQVRAPALVGRLAERADRRLQARGRYVAEVHVLGEMDKTIACDIGRHPERARLRPPGRPRGGDAAVGALVPRPGHRRRAAQEAR